MKGNAQIFSLYMRRSFVIYVFAPIPLNFLIYAENFIFFFISVRYAARHKWIFLLFRSEVYPVHDFGLWEKSVRDALRKEIREHTTPSKPVNSRGGGGEEKRTVDRWQHRQIVRTVHHDFV
jgi:hypothetical protein